MQVRATLSPAEYNEAAILLRPKYFWLRFFAANWYASLICILLIVLTVNSLINHSQLRLNNVIVMLIFGGGLIGWSYYRYTSNVSKAFEAQNGEREAVSLESDGVHLTGSGGTIVFIPWSKYCNWKEGHNIFLLKGEKLATVLPADDTDRDALRQLFERNIS